MKKTVMKLHLLHHCIMDRQVDNGSSTAENYWSENLHTQINCAHIGNIPIENILSKFSFGFIALFPPTVVFMPS